jgi:hypothetical protein
MSPTKNIRTSKTVLSTENKRHERHVSINGISYLLLAFVSIRQFHLVIQVKLPICLRAQNLEPLISQEIRQRSTRLPRARIVTLTVPPPGDCAAPSGAVAAARRRR